MYIKIRSKKNILIHFYIITYTTFRAASCKKLFFLVELFFLVDFYMKQSSLRIKSVIQIDT